MEWGQTSALWKPLTASSQYDAADTFPDRAVLMRTFYAAGDSRYLLEAGIAKHCLGSKIIDMYVCNFSNEICFTTKVPL